MPEIEVSLADTQQREACYRLAYRIYCGEMGAMRDLADHENQTLRDAAIEKAHVLCGYVDGQLGSTLGVLIGDENPFPKHFEQGFDVARFLPAVPRSGMALNIRFLVTEHYRSSMLPFRMMVAAALLQAERGVALSFCDCQPHLLTLYQTLGFRPYAPVFDQPGFGLMIPLVFSLVDFAYLRSIRSPLLRVLPPEREDPGLAARIAQMLPGQPPVLSATALERAEWNETYGVLSAAGSRPNAFEGFSEAELKAFLQRAQVLACARGQQVIAVGQGTRTAFVVLEGTVEVRLRGRPVAQMSPGEMFGEFAFLLNTARTADVFAASEMVRLLVLDERTMGRLLESHAELAVKFLLNLSRSLARRLVA